MTERTLTGPKELLMGPSGTGKTFALGTMVDWAAAQTPPKECFVLFTEPGLETLLGYWTDTLGGRTAREVPANLHWHQALTKPHSLQQLIKGADDVGRLSYELITKSIDPNRGGDNNSFWKLLKACSDFPDDRTGKTFGSVDSWGVDKIFMIDSLSALGNSAMKMQIGARPTASPSDYGVAQNNLINFLRLCTQGTAFTFVLIAHVDRETDEVSQTTKLMVKSVGKALVSEIPTLFSDVIYSVREGDKFYWSTAEYGVDTKTRSLGYRKNITPDFAQIMNVWKQRGGK